jgi:hypothetical protein
MHGMKRIKMGGALIVVALVTSSVVAASASATLPEFGRCVAVERGTGDYYGGTCVKPAGGKGTYDWLPGPGENKKFAGSIGPVKLETVGGYGVVCSSGDFTGEYTGPKTESVTLALVGCLEKVTERKCETLPIKEGEIETVPIEGGIGFISGGEKPRVGLDLKPAAPITFECGTGPEVHTFLSLEGSVIGLVKPATAMRSFFRVFFTASHGIQNPEKFEEGLKDTLTLQRTTAPEAPITEQAGLTIIGIEEIPRALIVVNEEPIEIKAR